MTPFTATVGDDSKALPAVNVHTDVPALFSAYKLLFLHAAYTVPSAAMAGVDTNAPAVNVHCTVPVAGDIATIDPTEGSVTVFPMYTYPDVELMAIPVCDTVVLDTVHRLMTLGPWGPMVGA